MKNLLEISPEIKREIEQEKRDKKEIRGKRLPFYPLRKEDQEYRPGG